MRLTRRAYSYILFSDGRQMKLTQSYRERKGLVLDDSLRMAVDGYGITAITRALNAQGVKSIGRGDSWYESYVRKLLTWPAVVGEYQSYTGRGADRKPFGPPIEGYFPAV